MIRQLALRLNAASLLALSGMGVAAPNVPDLVDAFFKHKEDTNAARGEAATDPRTGKPFRGLPEHCRALPAKRFFAAGPQPASVGQKLENRAARAEKRDAKKIKRPVVLTERVPV